MNILRFCQQSTNLCFVFTLLSVFALTSVPASGISGLAVSNVPNASNTFDHAAVNAASGFHVSDRSLLDANGTNFIMRGINHPHNWFPDETSSFANIKAKRANTVRVVLSSGLLWDKNSASDVANVISLCKANKLVCVLEVHDTTGYGEPGNTAATLAQSVAYWKEIQSVLTGQEAYVIINIGNEPYGNTNAVAWVNDTKNAIAEMRNAGFQHMLMVDAPNWGQDYEFVMRDNAASVFASDPNRNTVFSIHMYGVFESADYINNYLLSFVNAGLPLVIGEFGHLHSDGDPDEDAILSLAQTYGIGYLGWSWSGNCCGGEYLDMVTNFDPNQETWWGTRLIHGPNGIMQTSCEASVYGGQCFEDVPGNYWALDFIKRLYAAGITGGCNVNPLQYCPEATVTRAQMAVFLLRGIHGSSYNPPAVGSSTGFNDISPTYWAGAWIKQLAAEGITGGCGSGNYCPEAPVTRAQMAAFLLRSKYSASYSPPSVGDSTGFGDVLPGYWSAAWIKQLVTEGITAGCGSGNYCPEIPVTRAQMAVFLVRTFSLP
jgi:cellulase (glycosyl hydrolase family 5)/S-layer family protein